MKLSQPLLFPFSVGTTPASLALGVALFGFLGAAPVYFGSLLPSWMALPCGLLTAVWFFGLVALPFSFRTHRASDLVLDEQGLLVRAGRFSGRRLAWPQLAEAEAVRFAGRHGPPPWHLALPEGIVASSEEPDEAVSLAALADSLETLARGFREAQGVPPAMPLDRHVLRCAHCGAPLAVGDVERARCRFCGDETEVPDRLRAAIRDAAALAASRSATCAALGELQRWRRARTINLLLGAALLPLALSWPLVAAFTSEFFQYHDVLRWRDVFQLFFATFALSLGLVLLVQSQLVLRRAFALVAAAFHVRPPEQPGWPPACRHCGAPLIIAPEVPLVVCPYCRSDNVVLGVLLPHTVETEVRQSESLDVLLDQRARARRRWRFGFLVALALVALGGRVVASSVARARAWQLPRHAPVDRPWNYEPDWVREQAAMQRGPVHDIGAR